MLLARLRHLLRRKTAPNLLESHEYANLIRRNFRPYSMGHRRMYDIPIQYMRPSQYRIFEAGFGIGYGLEQMIAAGVLREYVGCEPDRDSFNYVRGQCGGRDGVRLIEEPFTQLPAGSPFDHAFCIEVIEHTPLDQHAQFLAQLRAVATELWFSTPCKTKIPHEGVRRTEEWEAMLCDAGFARVDVDKREWTHLYHCR